jgi:hypothetical protein
LLSRHSRRRAGRNGCFTARGEAKVLGQRFQCASRCCRELPPAFLRGARGSREQRVGPAQLFKPPALGDLRWMIV